MWENQWVGFIFSAFSIRTDFESHAVSPAATLLQSLQMRLAKVVFQRLCNAAFDVPVPGNTARCRCNSDCQRPIPGTHYMGIVHHFAPKTALTENGSGSLVTSLQSESNATKGRWHPARLVPILRSDVLFFDLPHLLLVPVVGSGLRAVSGCGDVQAVEFVGCRLWVKFACPVRTVRRAPSWAAAAERGGQPSLYMFRLTELRSQCKPVDKLAGGTSGAGCVSPRSRTSCHA